MELSWAIFGDQKQPQETKEEQKQRKKTPKEGKEADGNYFSAKFANSIRLFLGFFESSKGSNPISSGRPGGMLGPGEGPWEGSGEKRTSRFGKILL